MIHLVLKMDFEKYYDSPSWSILYLKTPMSNSTSSDVNNTFNRRRCRILHFALGAYDLY